MVLFDSHLGVGCAFVRLLVVGVSGSLYFCCLLFDVVHWLDFP